MTREEALLESIWFTRFCEVTDKYDRLVRAHNEFKDEYARMRDAIALSSVATRYTHKLAVMLECALLNRTGAWDEGHALLDEYRSACRDAMPEPQTFMGEPCLTHNTGNEPRR